MPITGASHVFGWEEATLDEKLEGLHDWCNILTAKLKAAGEETAALRERIRGRPHLSQARAQTKCRPARKLRAVFS